MGDLMNKALPKRTFHHLLMRKFFLYFNNIFEARIYNEENSARYSFLISFLLTR